jgi:hypothetical protein
MIAKIAGIENPKELQQSPESPSQGLRAKTRLQGKDDASGRSAAAVISVTGRGPPLAIFDPNGYGKQCNAHEYCGNKSTHILRLQLFSC